MGLCTGSTQAETQACDLERVVLLLTTPAAVGVWFDSLWRFGRNLIGHSQSREEIKANRTLPFGIDLQGYVSLMTTVLFPGRIQLVAREYAGISRDIVLNKSKLDPLLLSVETGTAKSQDEDIMHRNKPGETIRGWLKWSNRILARERNSYPA